MTVNFNAMRGQLLSCVATGVVGMLGAIGAGSPASAATGCALDTATSFACSDSADPTKVAIGSFSSGATFASGDIASVQVSSDSALEVSISGEVVSADEGYRPIGVYATAQGDVTLTAGDTTVAGVYSYGLWSDAFNGQNVLNTGSITASGDWSRGVVAQALPSDGYCSAPSTDLTVVINVTGDIVADYVGVTPLTCGTSTVNVQAGRTVAVTSQTGSAIRNIGSTAANTNIDGSVLGANSAGLALDVRDGPSNTNIHGTGLLSGTFDGDQWSDAIQIDAGGKWQTNDQSNFGSGADLVDNAGLILVHGGSAQFSELETLTNRGAIDLADGVIGNALTISGDYLGMAGSSVHLDASDLGADQLIIEGAARGTTSLFVNASVLISDPLLVVDTGTSDSGAFVLGTTSATPLIDLNLSQVGDDYFLTAVPSAAAMSPLRVGMAARTLWHQTTDAVFAQNPLRSLKSVRRTPLNLWVQGVGRPVGAGFMPGQNGASVNASTSKYRGVQGGVGYYLGKSVIGVTMGYMPGTVDSAARAEGLNTTNSSFGVYGLLGNGTGFHAGVVAKHERNAIRLANSAFAGAEGGPSTSTSGIEFEVGTRAGFLGGQLDIDVGMAYVRNSVRSFAAEGLVFELNDSNSARGRLGLRWQSGKENGLFASVKLYREFAGDEKMKLSSAGETASVGIDGGADSARLELGFGGSNQSSAGLSTWAELGSVKALGLSAGLRL